MQSFAANANKQVAIFETVLFSFFLRRTYFI